MKNRYWILLLAAAAAVLIIIGIAVKKQPSGHIANVYKDGECIRSIDLSDVKEPFSFTVTDEDGHENNVEVEKGRIRVVSANCPDQICVNMGWLSKGVTPIVCMPARLSINLEESAANTDADIVTR